MSLCIIQHLCRIVAGLALGFGLGGGCWAFINGHWIAILLLFLGAGIYIILKAYSMKTKLTSNEHCVMMSDRID